MRRNDDGQILGASRPAARLREEVIRVGKSSAKVLVTGESGVGKEIVAREIHANSARSQKPLVLVNCAGVAETLLESELFGHVKGSFTGAYRDKAGTLERAHQGTVFLDEVGEMVPRMQALLLRFLETGEVQKVGAERSVSRVDVRVIAATNRDLRARVASGDFREDLFYRLNVIHIEVPPLRERREDIPALAEHFLTILQADGSGRRLTLTPDAMTLLCEYAWPGNVRELFNVMERVIVTTPDDVVRPDDLPAELRRSATTRTARPREAPEGTVDVLYRRMLDGGESFWTVVYPMYMNREITSDTVRDILRRGLADTRGNYRMVGELFNMAPSDYKRFLNFLRKHGCQPSFKAYRTCTPVRTDAVPAVCEPVSRGV